jgi:hypothetical protein
MSIRDTDMKGKTNQRWRRGSVACIPVFTESGEMNKKDEQYCRRIVEQLLYTGERVLRSVAACTMPRKSTELLTKSAPCPEKLYFANISSMAHSEVRQHSQRMRRPHEQGERETGSAGDAKCIQSQTPDHTPRHPGMELKLGKRELIDLSNHISFGRPLMSNTAKHR